MTSDLHYFLDEVASNLAAMICMAEAAQDHMVAAGDIDRAEHALEGLNRLLRGESAVDLHTRHGGLLQVSL